MNQIESEDLSDEMHKLKIGMRNDNRELTSHHVRPSQPSFEIENQEPILISSDEEEVENRNSFPIEI